MPTRCALCPSTPARVPCWNRGRSFATNPLRPCTLPCLATHTHTPILVLLELLLLLLSHVHPAATHKFTNGTQQFAFVYSNATSSVAFIENDAALYVQVLFNGVQLTLSPSSVLIYDVHAQAAVYDTYAVEAAATHREFQQVCGGGPGERCCGFLWVLALLLGSVDLLVVVVVRGW